MASKIGKTEWKLLYAITGALDAIEIFFPPASVIDFFVGPLLFVYFWIRGVSMFDKIGRFVSLFGFWVSSSVLVTVEPFWILDIWYIHRSVRQEEAEDRNTEEQQRLMQAGNLPLYQNGQRTPPPINNNPSTPPPLNKNGIRYPRK